jgi:carboxypeptidase C (cathepsin A)
MPRVSPLAALALLLVALLSGDFARAGDDAAKQPEKAPPAKQPVATLPDASKPPVVTEHAIEIGGRELAYKAEAGMLPLLKEDGGPRASIFYVAYTLVTEADAAARPIMFCFNGGPGASAVWLHLGGLGPRRAKVNPDGSLPPPPFELVANEHTILPACDLVFIDPVSTGYSRAAKDEKAAQFYGKDPDIEAMAEFIRLYTTRNTRWRSPKYLCGESYGVFRAAGLAAELQNDHGMFLNGLVLVSGLVDYGTIIPGPSNDLPFSLFLPSFTAVAHAHGRLPEDLQADRAKALAEAEAFAAGEYWTALYAGAALPEPRRTAVAATIGRLTGLSEKFVLDHDLRVDPSAFREELLADERLILGRFDGRITGRDGDQAGGDPRFDPSYDAALGPLAAAMNAYVREELEFESDLPYKVLTGLGPWPQEQNRYSSTARQLGEAMSRNHHLRVLVQTGACDLAVPYLSLVHSINHLAIDPELLKNVTSATYDSGHMMYLKLEDLAKLERDLRAFLAPAAPAPANPKPTVANPTP